MTTFVATPWVAEHRSVIDTLGRIIAQPIQDGLVGDGTEDYKVAKLIAAAPDMLAALQQSRDALACALRHACPDIFETEEQVQSHITIAAIDAAIKKATAEGQAA